MFTSDSSLIDDPRLTVDDKEVTFSVGDDKETTVYSMSTDEYSSALEIEAVVNDVVNDKRK
ncbi:MULTISPECIES: hypothetical protein [unclassified Nostoc]|jgi:hypothetical protein|uniref:hypothetical protein n=1 Tax=unclassified Nostoc TaxID=2593658 RepID=UPI002AD4EE26|nr:hypothetical protein [Nostoc sp. DedQUE03]MDZ7974500.1 hypothetical protein [Nostoc sp. DedQUE03]MDZ8047096.1 hypothetical protein [Nostoc sp. DedQUE02]